MVTIIIPTHKPKEYIDDCLQSLDLQTFEKRLFEVIVVLNGEKEPYYSMVQDKLRNYTFNSRLLYSSIANVSNARNIGLDYADGDYICFVDDDDCVSPNYIEDLYSVVGNCQDCIIVSNVKTFMVDNGKTGDDYISKAFDFFSTHQTRSIYKKRKFLSSSCCKLIPLSIIDKERFDTKYRIGEDGLFMFAISKKIRRIELSHSTAIYYRRLRPNSASRQIQSFSTRVREMMDLIKAYIQLYCKHVRQYNVFLFISRIVAVIKTYLK